MDSRTETRSAWAVYAALLFGTFITIEACGLPGPGTAERDAPLRHPGLTWPRWC